MAANKRKKMNKSVMVGMIMLASWVSDSPMALHFQENLPSLMPYDALDGKMQVYRHVITSVQAFGTRIFPSAVGRIC